MVTATPSTEVRVPAPDVKRSELVWLSQHSKIFSVHPDVARLLAGSETVRTRAVEHGAKTNEFLLVEFDPNLSRDDVEKCATIMHKMRGKELPVSYNKVSGLQDRGFMMVYEPNVIPSLRRMLPGVIKDAGEQSAGRG